MCIIWIKLSRWLWKPLGQLISDVHFINNLLQIYFSSTLWIITNNYLYYHASFLDIIIPDVSISLLQGTWVPWSWFPLFHFFKTLFNSSFNFYCIKTKPVSWLTLFWLPNPQSESGLSSILCFRRSPIYWPSRRNLLCS